MSLEESNRMLRKTHSQGLNYDEVDDCIQAYLDCAKHSHKLFGDIDPYEWIENQTI
jgi:hypothetical protein